VSFPLELLSATVNARAEFWERLGMHWHCQPIQPNHGKPVVSAQVESSKWLVEIMVWSSGEAELATLRLADDRCVNKHYELGSQDDLGVLLDELLELLVNDRIPVAAVVARWPATLG
jgi:hypothetical protein